MEIFYLGLILILLRPKQSKMRTKYGRKAKKSQKIYQMPPPPPTIKRELELKELPDKGQREERAVALATISSPGRRAAGGRRERRAFAQWGKSA